MKNCLAIAILIYRSQQIAQLFEKDKIYSKRECTSMNIRNVADWTKNFFNFRLLHGTLKLIM